jgi:hypothetical protein
VDYQVLTFLGKTTLHYSDFSRSQDGSLLLLDECLVP